MARQPRQTHNTFEAFGTQPDVSYFLRMVVKNLIAKEMSKHAG